MKYSVLLLLSAVYGLFAGLARTEPRKETIDSMYSLEVP